MRERAKLLGGELSVRSAPNDGTTVSVSLPATRRQQPAIPEASESRTGCGERQ
jgi:signal transduction histidine kinase